MAPGGPFEVWRGILLLAEPPLSKLVVVGRHVPQRDRGGRRFVQGHRLRRGNLEGVRTRRRSSQYRVSEGIFWLVAR